MRGNHSLKLFLFAFLLSLVWILLYFFSPLIAVYREILTISVLLEAALLLYLFKNFYKKLIFLFALIGFFVHIQSFLVFVKENYCWEKSDKEGKVSLGYIAHMECHKSYQDIDGLSFLLNGELK